MTKSHYLKIFKSQYLVEFLRYGSNFGHVIISLIGFKITFSNIRSHGAPCRISRGWRLAHPSGLKLPSQTMGLGLDGDYHLRRNLNPSNPAIYAFHYYKDNNTWGTGDGKTHNLPLLLL